MQQTQTCRTRPRKVLFSISISALKSCINFLPHQGEATPQLKAIIIHTLLKIEASFNEVEVVIAQNNTKTTALASLTTSNIPPCLTSKDQTKL